MTNDKPTRWSQRFQNYKKALAQLAKFIKKKRLNELEKQGLVQAFEYTHELAWKTLADFLKSRGNEEIYGSKDVTRQAFHLGLIEQGEIWMEMILSRNMTSHTYNETTVNQIVQAIQDHYFANFLLLENKLDQLMNEKST